MQALTPHVNALFKELGKQYEMLKFEQSRRSSIAGVRYLINFKTQHEAQLDELLEARIKLVEDALAKVAAIKNAIHEHNTTYND